MKIIAAFLLLFLITFSDISGQTRVVVDARQKSEPISRYLFSKFTEHIGKNVYQGAWAQVVENPEFVSIDVWPKRGTDHPVINQVKRAETIFQLEKLTDDSREGIAAFWQSSGKIDGRLLKEGIRYYQQLKTYEEEARLQTGIFLPLHRTSGYEVSITARSRSSADIHVKVLSADLVELGKMKFSLDQHWNTYDGKMIVTPGNHERGTPYLLQVDIGSNAEVEISRVLMFPDDHLGGWDPEVVQLMKEAQLPMLRFPGGNFVSGYDWRDGVGPIDQRPVLPNPAWPIMEWNHVGTDEWINFCRLIGAEPMICINAGDGTPEEAADWVKYCNDPVNTKMGKLRSDNGSGEPYNVKIWEVGNELCGPWQIGFTDGDGYAERYKRFAEGMLDADPGIQLIANGLIRVLEKSEPIDRGGDSGWNYKLMQLNGDLVRSISVHSLVGGYLHNPEDPVEIWKDLVGYAENYPEYLHELVAEPMLQAGVEPKVAITELMDWPRHPKLGNVTSISGALWYSAMINVAIRSEGLIEIITHSALLNHGGGLQKDRGVVFTDPVYWANYLYATQPGTIPVKVTSNTRTFDSSGKYIVKKTNIPVIDSVALMDEEGMNCTVILTNRSHDTEQEVALTVKGFDTGNHIEKMTIGCGDLALRNNWQNPSRIFPEFDTINIEEEELNYTLPPLSIIRLSLKSN